MKKTMAMKASAAALVFALGAWTPAVYADAPAQGDEAQVVTEGDIERPEDCDGTGTGAGRGKMDGTGIPQELRDGSGRDAAGSRGGFARGAQVGARFGLSYEDGTGPRAQAGERLRNCSGAKIGLAVGIGRGQGQSAGGGNGDGSGAGVRVQDGTGQGARAGQGAGAGKGEADGRGLGKQDGTGPRSETGECQRTN